MRSSPKYMVDVLSPFFVTKQNNSTINGSLFPSSDGANHDIGKQFMPWENGYFNNLFAGDTDVGLALAGTVLAGVGLVSDLVQFKDGSPTLSMGVPGTLDKDTINQATNSPDTHTHAIIEYSDGSTETGTEDELVSTDANGQLKVSRSVAHQYFEGPLWQSLDSVSEDTTAQPTGDLYLDPGSDDVLPGTSADTTVSIDIGAYDAAFLEVYAARGLFGVLPSDGMQTGVAGAFRSTGGGVTFLTRDILGAETTTIYVNTQAFEADEWAILHAVVEIESVRTEQIEVIKFESAGVLQGAGDYLYTVTRAEYGSVGGVVVEGGASFDQNNDFDTWYFDYQPSNNPFLPGLETPGSGSVGGWYAGNAVISLGKAAGAGLIEWTSQKYVDGGDGPGLVGWIRTGTAAWDDLVPFFMVGNGNGYMDYAADQMVAGMGIDMTVDPDTYEFHGFVVDTGQARAINAQSEWYLPSPGTAQIGRIFDTGFKFGIDMTADATTGFQFDSSTGDFVYGELANDYVRWDHSGDVMDILGLLTGSRFTYLKALDIASATVPNGETDGVNIFYDNTLDHVRAKDDAGAYRNLDVTTLDGLTDVIITSATENDSFFFDGATWVNGAGHRLNIGTETAMTIATGAIDISTVGTNGLIDLRGEGSTDDFLVTITGGNIGDVIVLTSADSATYGEITIQNTGNIAVPTDTTLDLAMYGYPLMLTAAGWIQPTHSSRNYIDFNVDYSDGHKEGRIHWDTEDGTLSVGMPGGNVELQLGQEMLVRCRNETGVQIDNGSVVYASGASGNKPLLGLADATDPLKLAVLGMATEDIAHNANGYVNTKGFVRGINTLGMTIGLPVFLDDATPGGFTQTRPIAPNYLWIMGIVIAAHATEGVVYNASTPGHVMMSLSDVLTAVPADGEYLAWSIANSRFELEPAPSGGGGGATELDDLTDVDTAGLSDNDILVYDLSTLKWLPEAPAAASIPALDDLTDVIITTPADDELLAYDTGSGDWINQTAAEAGLATSGHTHAVGDLSDAVITGVTDNELFAYDSGSGDWINQTAAEAGLSTVDELADLSDVDGTAPTDGQVLTWDNANAWWEPDDLPTPIPATVTVPQSFDVYIDVKERLSEQRIHGDLPTALTTADTLDSGTPIVLTTGVSKLLISVIAASDFDGSILITGTSVDRNTKAETPADTESITVDALTTDASTTDANGNTVHAFTGAYISGKWWKGSVTLSTTNLTITDVDVYQVSFEQFGDNENITVQTLDVTTEVTNTAAWCDVYMYALEVTGDKCNVAEIAGVHLTVGDSEANKYYRLREGLINKALDGTTDGIWVDAAFGPLAQTYWEDISIKVWYDIDLSVAGDTLVAADGTALWNPDFPPETPTAYDDEFDDTAFDTALWSEFDVSTLLTVSEDVAGLKMLQTANAGDDITGIYQAIPVGDFSIVTKVSASAEDADHYHIGLALWEDATTTIDAIYHFALHYEATASTEITAILWTDHDTYASTLYDGPEAGDHATMQYLRLRRNSTTYYFEVSADGVGWLQVWSGTLAWVPAHFGIALNQNGVSNLDLAARAQFFRYVSSDVGNGGLMEGQRVVVQAQAQAAPNETTVMDLLHSQKTAADTPDDEFDGLVLDPKWTVVSGSSGTIDFLEAGDVAKYELDTTYNKLLMQTGDLASNLVEMRQDWTLGDGESIVVAVSHGMEMEDSTTSNNELNVGISLNDTDTGWDDGNYFRINWDVDASKDIGIMSYDGSLIRTAFAAEGLYYPLAFLRITRDGSNYYAMYSQDGFTWMRLGTTTGTIFTNLWLFSTCGSTSLNPPIPTSIFHWVRQGANTQNPWSPLIRIRSADIVAHLLDDHTDVEITGTPADDEVLAYNSATDEWINQTATEAGISIPGHIHSLDGDLDDVVIGSAIDDDILAWNTATGKWVNQTAAEAGLASAGHTHELGDLTDVVITGVTNNEVLAWSGTQWINQTGAEAGLSEPGHLHYLDGDNSDVNIISVDEDDILAWDDVAGEWQNQTAAEAGLATASHAHAIDDLSDATITGTPADNEVLAYDGISDFINQTAAEAGLSEVGHTHTAPALDDITDVTISGTPADNELLAYNTGTGEFINQTAVEAGLASALDDLSDVTITTPAAGHNLVRGGSGWVNQRGNRQNVGARQDVTLVTDAATISSYPNQGFFNIRGQGAAADDLSTITGGNDGDVIMITASVEDITVKNGVGNIDCDGDTVMNAADNIMTLVLTGGTWYETAFISGS